MKEIHEYIGFNQQGCFNMELILAHLRTHTHCSSATPPPTYCALQKYLLTIKQTAFRFPNLLWLFGVDLATHEVTAIHQFTFPPLTPL